MGPPLPVRRPDRRRIVASAALAVISLLALSAWAGPWPAIAGLLLSALVITGFWTGHIQALQGQLALTDARLAQVYDFNPIGIAALDSDGRYTYVNPAYRAIYGWESEAFIGRTLVDMVVPLRDRYPMTQILLQAVQSGELPEPREWEQRCKSGGRVVVRHHFDVIYDAGGRGMGVLIAADDVTATFNLEHELGRASRTVQRLAEALPDPVGIVVDGRVVWANGLLLSLLGFEDVDDAVGSSMVLYVAEEERPGWGQLMERAAQAPVAPVQLELLTRDNRRLAAEVSALPLVFQTERAVMVVARDLTNVRSLEAQVKQLDRMASLGTLAAGVAHEINNPLTYIHLKLHCAIAEVEGLQGFDPAVAKGLKDALDGANRVREIVKELRTFSHQGSEMTTVDVESVVEGALRIVSNEVRHNAIVVRDFGVAPPVYGNQGRLAQVFLNLVTNALHAVEDRGAGVGEIRICTRLIDDMVEISVQDSGVGVPPEMIDRVFDAFFTTKATGRGTGLGLAVCRNIVEEHGGTISVSSPIGEGATFTVRIHPLPRGLAI